MRTGTGVKNQASNEMIKQQSRLRSELVTTRAQLATMDSRIHDLENLNKDLQNKLDKAEGLWSRLAMT